MVPIFWENGEIFAHYKRKVCQMKQQVKRSSLNIYLGRGWVEYHRKLALNLRMTGGCDGDIGVWEYIQDNINIIISLAKVRVTVNPHSRHGLLNISLVVCALGCLIS